MTAITNNLANTKSTLKKVDKVREIDELKKQVEDLKSENELLKSKVKAVTARKQILENEIKETKDEYEKNKKILLEKSENDNKYIQ